MASATARQTRVERGLVGGDAHASLRPASAAGQRAPGRRRRAASRAALSRCLLVHVDDLGLAHRRAGAGGDERGRDVAGVLRAGREDGGVHLDAGRDTEDGHAVADDLVRCRGPCRRRRRRGSGRRRAGRARRRRRACRRRSSSRPARRGCSTTVSKPCATARSRAHRVRRGHDRQLVAADARAAPAPAGAVGREGCAPSRARASTTAPSVPLRPTRPPMPAIGLTIRPMRLTRACLRCGALPRPRPPPADGRDHLLELVLGDRRTAARTRSSPRRGGRG